MDPWTAFTFFDGWSVYGIRAKEDGRERCFVIASTKVKMLEMNHRVSNESFTRGGWLADGWKSARITQQLAGDMGVGEGDTFQEALADLFGGWNPDARPEELEATPAIEARAFELPPGHV